MMALHLSEIRTNHEMVAKIEAEAGPNPRETKAPIKDSQERMGAPMNVGLEMMEACLEKEEATELETYPE
jgi:hypothetical protein